MQHCRWRVRCSVIRCLSMMERTVVQVLLMINDLARHFNTAIGGGVIYTDVTRQASLASHTETAISDQSPTAMIPVPRQVAVPRFTVRYTVSCYCCRKETEVQKKNNSA